MKRTSILAMTLSATLLALLVVNCTSSGESVEEATDGLTATNGPTPDPNCVTAPASWFPHAKTQDPAEGADSPFGDPNKTTNCDFHRWSWQKFLYLTKPGPGGKALFETLLYHVDNELTLLNVSKGGTNLVLKDTTQAGNTAGTIYDRKNKPIYYSIYVSKEMYDFSQAWLDKFMKAGINNLKSFGYDTIDYPTGCLEVKASWMLASSMDKADLKDYYVTQAHMGNIDGPVVDVVLLGMHVVGVVDNHPEFIWATFEHDMLAPTYDWKNSQGTAQVLSDKKHVFYDAGKTANDIRMNFGTAKKYGFKNIYEVYRLGMAQSATDASLPNQKDLQNNANIEALNKSVKANLDKEQGPWTNYFYVGSTWIDPTVQKLKPNDKQMGKLTNANLRGSRAVSNVTMETFEQPDVQSGKATGPNNCFTCHTTQDDESGTPKIGYNLALSHLFTNAFYVRRNPKLKGTIHL